VSRWQLQEAKQQFSRVVDRARSDGAQIVMRHGKDVAVVISIEEYRRLADDGEAFKRFLLEGPKFDGLEIERSTEPARIIEF
jgi:prevent-host-death family protein